jgi:hypothetical protein
MIRLGLLYSLIWTCLYYTINKKMTIPEKYIEKTGRFFLISNYISFIHATIISIFTGLTILNNYDWEICSPLTMWQYHIVSLSFGYFSYDLYHRIFTKPDLMFALHHIVSLICLYCVLTTELYGRFIVTALFLGEVTNPFQTIWYISKKTGLCKLEKFVFPIFFFSFTLIRCIIGPYIILNWGYKMIMNGCPVYYSLIISSGILLGSLGSVFWISKMNPFVFKKNNGWKRLVE